MSCRSCDLKRIYKLFEEKKRREAEEAKALSEAIELKREQEEKEKLIIKTTEKSVVEETKEEIPIESEMVRLEEISDII